jgi:glycosyltransferase involved in cell wall biosynthesis
MKVTVIIPCFNEAKTITRVIKDFPREQLTHNGFELDVLVVDNNSTDKTAEYAEKAGARVIHEFRQGKGRAMHAGFSNLAPDTKIVVMIDGDGTYRSQEILRMIEPLHSGFCDVVMGSRLTGKMHEGAMRTFNRGGNWAYTHMVRLVYGVNVTDVLTGYFAWKRSTINRLAPQLKSSGFAIEMEMITKMAKMKCNVYSVPISYHPRTGKSNLRPIHDGLHILRAFGKNLRWRPNVELEDGMGGEE